MIRKRLSPAQQGGPDGLCGFYALLNFVHNLDSFRERSEATTNREAFRYLAESAEQLGLLTAHHLWDGFEWPKLLAIFNRTANDWRLGFVAVPLVAVSEHCETNNIHSVAKIVVDDGGAVVAHLAQGHWVLIYGANDKGLFIDDSELSESERVKPWHMKAQEAAERFDGATVGLALVPQRSKLASLK